MEPLLPGPVRQNGYVVRDLDTAIAAWLALGVGPWITLGPMEQPGFYCRGEPTTPTITLAFANSGDLQIELIEQTGDAPSAYKEFLDSGREGFHHLAWWTEDFDAVEADVRAAGWDIVFGGDTGVAKFFYAEAPTVAATCLEVMELNDMTQGLADHVKQAADTWDGESEPVRKLF